MKHSSLGAAIFVAGMMAANAADAQFTVVGPTPRLVKAPGVGVFAPGFNGPTLASDFGIWLSFPQPPVSVLQTGGGILESRGGPFGPDDDFFALVLGKYVFSPSNQGLQGFTVDFQAELLSDNMSVDFDLFGATGPREKFTIQAPRPTIPGEQRGSIEFKVRDEADRDVLVVRASAINTLASPVQAHIEYNHALGTVLFSVTDKNGQHLEVPANWTIQHPFRVSLQAEKEPRIAGSPSAKWRNLVTNLQIPDHLQGSVSPLRNNITGITYDNLPLGLSGVAYVDPSTPVFGANFVAGAPDGSVGDVAMPSILANYSAMVIETSPGILFKSTGLQTIFTTSTVPGNSVLPLDPVRVVAFFPNCFIAPNTPVLNPSNPDYKWNDGCLTTATTPGVDLAVSGWMAIPRPGFARKTYVYVNSLGDQMNSVAGDTLTITTPPEFINPVITAPAGASCSPAPPVFVCQLPQIGINLNLSFVIDYTVSLGATLGNTVDVQADLSVTNDANPDNNRFHISDPVQGAVDPNDKLAIPEAGPIVPGELLHYVVRFENVGNLATDSIVISDTLDPNLDRTSVAFISDGGVYDPAGHSISWLLKTPLDPGKQGFVEFWAKARADLRPGDTITNRASITFDFNAPLATAPVVHFIPTPAVPRLQDTLDCLDRLLARGGLAHKARHEVVKAIKDVHRAVREQARGDLEDALQQVEHAVKHLLKATKDGADLSSCQPLTSLWSWALDQVDRRIAAAAAAAGEKNKNVKKAREERAQALAAQARGDWSKAFEELISAARYAGKALPQSAQKGDAKRETRD